MNSRKAVYLFGVLALVLAVLTVVLSFTGRKAAPIVVGGTARAKARVIQFLEDVPTADAGVISGYFPAGTDLDNMFILDNPVSRKLCTAVWQSLRYENPGEVRGDTASLSMEVTVQAMDAAAVLESAKALVRPMVEKKVSTAASLDSIYDADNHYREEFLNQVLLEALDEVLKEAACREQNLTIYIRRSDSGWEILPEDSLINVLSGWMKE